MKHNPTLLADWLLHHTIKPKIKQAFEAKISAVEARKNNNEEMYSDFILQQGLPPYAIANLITGIKKLKK